MSRKPKAPEPETLERHFEGRARLAALLKKAGSPVDSEDVAEGFAQAQKDGLAPADVMPELFDGEPRFEKAADARALYSNLLGLWDLVASGAKLDLAAPPPREKKPKPIPVPAPPPFEGEPDAAWVESAWRYLEACSPKELTRLEHAFENRQDALLYWLEQEWDAALASGTALTDDAFGVVRGVCFELFALLHLGRAKGWPRVKPEALEAGAGTPPAALAAWAEELVFDATQDEARALSAAETEQLRRLVPRALAALWDAAD